MQRLLMLCMCLLLANALQAASVYKWIDPATGKTVFSDQPPPASVKAQEKNMTGNTIQTSGMGYSLKEATRKFPVTLFASDCGEPCDNARQLLLKRGIPFSSKNPQTQKLYYDELKTLVGDATVPTILIGQKPSKGFDAGAWNSALDEAGYPAAAQPGTTVPEAGKAPKPAGKSAN